MIEAPRFRKCWTRRPQHWVHAATLRKLEAIKGDEWANRALAVRGVIATQLRGELEAELSRVKAQSIGELATGSARLLPDRVVITADRIAEAAGELRRLAESSLAHWEKELDELRLRLADENSKLSDLADAAKKLAETHRNEPRNVGSLKELREQLSVELDGFKRSQQRYHAALHHQMVERARQTDANLDLTKRLLDDDLAATDVVTTSGGRSSSERVRR